MYSIATVISLVEMRNESNSNAAIKLIFALAMWQYNAAKTGPMDIAWQVQMALGIFVPLYFMRSGQDGGIGALAANDAQRSFLF